MTGAVIHPFIKAPAACIHKEVADRGQFQAQLLGDGDLQLFGWTLVLLEDGVESPPLHVCEHQPGLLGHISPLTSPVVLFFTLTCCSEFTSETQRKRWRVRELFVKLGRTYWCIYKQKHT